jgi:hypothetical protein
MSMDRETEERAAATFEKMMQVMDSLPEPLRAFAYGLLAGYGGEKVAADADPNYRMGALFGEFWMAGVAEFTGGSRETVEAAIEKAFGIGDTTEH